MLRSHDSFGGGAGEGLAAVRGHQSGAKGMQAEMPAFSREIEAIGSYDSASRHQLRFLFGHAGRVPLPMQRARGALGRAAKMAAFPVSAARSASAPYQLED